MGKEADVRPSQAIPAPPPETPAGPVILVVDDDADNVQLAVRVLRRAGYREVHGLTDPRRAADLAEALAPDLVLVDLHMPHLDGLTVIAQLRPLLPPATGIILVTGELDEQARQAARLAGASDIVSKPFEFDELLKCVARQLGTPHGAA